MTYARAIRIELQRLRADGIGFDKAWGIATLRTAYPKNDPWTSMLPYLRREMQSAYEGVPSRNKPSRLEPPEPSPDGLSVAATASQGPSTPMRSTQLCVSGDGCTEIATHGRFGKAKFCERHHAEIHKAMGDLDTTEIAMAEHHARQAEKRDGAPSSIVGMRGFAGVKDSSRTKGGKIGGAIRGAQLRRDAA